MQVLRLKSIHRSFALSCALFAAAAVVPNASGTNLFWDGDGTGTVNGGSGTWDTTATRWSTSATGSTYQAWVNANNDDAFFPTVLPNPPSGVSNVSVSVPITVNAIHFQNAANVVNFIVSGTGAFTLTSGVVATEVPTASTTSYQMNPAITVPSTGGNVGNGTNGDLIVANNTTSGSSSMTLFGANTFADLRFTSTGSQNGRDQVVFGSLTAIKNIGVGNAATIYMNRDNAQISWGSTGVWDGQSVYNNIVLNADNSSTADFTNNIGVNGSYDIDYFGTISSAATGNNVSNLLLSQGTSGGTGVLNLKNAASYNGTTRFLNANAATNFAGAFRNDTGADNALPVTTRLIWGAGNTAASGAYDLNGHSQTVTGLSTLPGSTGPMGGVVNTSANPGSLKINATATQDPYTGNIGLPYQSITLNSGNVFGIYKRSGSSYPTNDNISVELLASSDPTAAVTFSRPAGMTYNGGTTIKGGILLLNNLTGSGTGSGTVNVGNGTGNLATIGGIGSISGDLTLLNQGRISPGSTGSDVGIFHTANQQWGVGGSYRFDLVDAAGVAGTGFDQTKLDAVAGSAINLTSNSGSKFTIVAAGGPTGLTGENQGWVIADGGAAVQLNGTPVDGTTAAAFNAVDWANYFAFDSTLFTGFPEGTFSVQITGGDFSDLTLTYVPEPGSMAMLLSGAALLLRRKPRRRVVA
jgi:hypothetical protein